MPVAFRFVAFLAVFLTAQGVCAEGRLYDYLYQAAEQNAGIKSAFENWQASLARVAYSNRLPDPKITYGHFIESVETRVGPQKFRLGLGQMIPWLGKLSSRKDVASQQALLAEEMLAQAYVSLRLDLTEAFLHYLYIEKAIGTQKDYIDLSRTLEQTAQVQVKVGGSGADVIQAQMEVNRLEYELVTLAEKRITAMARINAILNVPAGNEVPLPSDIEEYVAPPKKKLALLDEHDLKSANPEMKIIDAQKRVLEARRKLVHKERFPDFTVGVDWIKTDRAVMATPDSGKDPVMAFVSINLPIWRSTYRSQEREVENLVESVAHTYRQQGYRLQFEQERILFNFSDAKRRIELYGDLLLPEAEQALSILTDAYKTGRSDFERLQNAEIALLNLQLKLERARSDLGIAVAQYQAMVGES